MIVTRFNRLLNLTNLRRVLFLLIVVSFVYVLYSLAFVEDNYSLTKLVSYPAGSARQVVGDKQSQEKDYSAFLKDVAGKKIFAPVKIKKAKTKKTVDRSKLKKVIESLRVAGIIGTGGKKVIIEDKRKNTTFHLRQGETFLGDIRVEKISNDSVVLDYQGEKFELYL